MKTGKMLKDLGLNERAFAVIKSSVQTIESATSGEIALALTAESSSYAFWELFAAVIASAVFFALLLPFAKNILQFSARFFWVVPAWYMPFVYGCGILSAIIAVFFLANIRAIDRLIVPKSVFRQSVYERALRYFSESGVYKTSDRSGVLIFASYLEKHVFILADTGIAQKIEQAVWDKIAAKLASDLGKGSGEKAFLCALEECGALLAKYFPKKSEGRSELPDGLAVL